jgi:small subunit ribosomal protein S6
MKKAKNYELMVILKPNLPENVRNSAIEKIQSILASTDATVTATDNWGKRYLAYPIMKHNEGYYMVYDFESTSNKTAELNKSLNLVNQVLRFIIVNK